MPWPRVSSGGFCAGGLNHKRSELEAPDHGTGDAKVTISRRVVLLSGLSLHALTSRRAAAAEDVRIGQATPALSFLPLWAARAYDTFGANGLNLSWAAIPGGDPAALAALDAGDIDVAAVGSDTALAAISKSQPFILVYSLLSKMSLEVVASEALLKRAGVGPQDPLAKRIGALKGAVIGVSAVGGTQDRIVRWIVSQGGLDPATGVQVAMVGPPPAIQAALENGRIDGFALSPPESGLAEAGGYGKRLIDPDKDFPQLHGMPYLVLVAKRDPDPATSKRISGAVTAMVQAAAKVTASPDDAADLIGTKLFAKIPQSIMRGAVRSMLDGLEGGGRFTDANIEVLTRFSTSSGMPVPTTTGYWTNRFIAA
jgi:NitT/TauT family transport system substrate-binding protein